MSRWRAWFNPRKSFCMCAGTRLNIAGLGICALIRAGILINLCRPLQCTVPGDKTAIAKVISSLFVFPYPSGRGLYYIIFILNPAHPRPVFLPAIGQISTNPSSRKDANIQHARSDHRGSSSRHHDAKNQHNGKTENAQNTRFLRGKCTAAGFPAMNQTQDEKRGKT